MNGILRWKLAQENVSFYPKNVLNNLAFLVCFGSRQKARLFKTLFESKWDRLPNVSTIFSDNQLQKLEIVYMRALVTMQWLFS